MMTRPFNQIPRPGPDPDQPPGPPRPLPDPGQPPIPVPPEPSRPGPAGPRTPYPVNDPGITDLPGGDPDYEPGKPAEPGTF